MFVNSQEVDQLFRAAIGDGVAPGFQYVVFNKNEIISSKATGISRPVSEADPAGVPMFPQTPVNLTSAGKFLVSIVALAILQRGLAYNGMTLEDLDNHEKLIEVLPEFGSQSGSWAGKMFVGFEPHLGPDGKKVPILREPTVKVTLRHIFTHTSGHPYFWTHQPTMEFYNPSDSSIPLRSIPMVSGRVSDLEVPMMFEPGTVSTYGIDTDWLGIFASRATGKGLHSLLREFILDPLDLPPSEFQSTWTEELNKTLATVHLKQSDGKFVPTALSVYACDDDIPPPGYFHVAAGPSVGSTRMLSKVLQAVMRHDTTLLSKRTWAIAIADSLKPLDIKMCKPRWTSLVDLMSMPVDEYCPAECPEDGSSANLLQAEIATGPRRTGRPGGTYAWAGRFNTFWAIDEANDIGYAFTAHILPFYDPGVVKLRDELEKLIWGTRETAKQGAVGPRYTWYHPQHLWKALIKSIRMLTGY